MIEITKGEANNILALLDRVQVSGKEAMTVATLQSKLSKGLEAEEKEIVAVDPKKKIPTETPKKSKSVEKREEMQKEEE